jgi:diaminohydroxyphosphoribosylaminopyrimidine deaminase / 5-amino-6-(5-phosphoribosylamino)uracil reductase
MDRVSDAFMYRCLELAEQGRRRTGINPMVGAVLVRDGSVIAEGFHEEFGKAHAERQLLEKYEQKIDSKDTLYVNLEPCVHTAKKTPPCAQMLVERGVKRVVVGMVDPNPEVSGKGIAFLRSQGVEVMCPVLTADCLRLNRGYVSLMTKGRPWVVMQQARTPDGRFAGPNGEFLKISSLAQDTWTHRYLRAKNDAVLIGIGTALMDNPSLTVRHVPEAIQPWRVLIDSRLRLPLHANLVADAHAHRTIIVIRSDLGAGFRGPVTELRSRGVRVLDVAHDENGIVFPALWKALTTPDGNFHGIRSILFEGGQRMWEAFRSARCIDEEAVVVGVPAPGSETRVPLMPSH